MIIILIVAALIFVVVGTFYMLLQPDVDEREPEIHINEKIKLHEPRNEHNISIEEALLERRSIREYKCIPLTLTEVSQLLWAAQGITDPAGFRTAPSAGVLYPLEVYVVIGNVEGVTEGVYKYTPDENELVKVKRGDAKDELTVAVLGQTQVRDGSIFIVIYAVYEETTKKYGDRGIRYVYMEAEHAAQNVYLQLVSLNLGTVVIGAFRDDKVKRILNMPDNEDPLHIMPVGKI